jgi:hypothetical protein
MSIIFGKNFFTIASYSRNMIHPTNMQAMEITLLTNPTHLLETGDPPNVFPNVT